ncbi:MBL fold metallo-hydrolase [Maribellus maritimus]|uniref:MBL fold metallo-hydrolase n=1 Tax=Maribellus maritimus TaxID=2870838 RepID=UPI001EEB9DDA|nr:MBL fold metallo-hydrolase [Maribellus maritimus]MCG6189369.1 MBL fold metallo-hydrolase [Maribellus maritimus]
MKIQLVRNATVKIYFGGKVWLVDPFFANERSLPPFAGKAENPTVPLPISIPEILEDVDYVMITHLHPDHFDEKAQEEIPKSVPFVIQKADSEKIKTFGFEAIEIQHERVLDNVRISRVDAQHGEGEILKVMGDVSGYVLEDSKNEVLYITGDTIWCDKVKRTVDKFSPNVVICNAGGNVFLPENHPFKEYISLDHTHKVIMDEKQVLQLLNHKKDTTVVTVHIGALDHETVSRKELRQFLKNNDVCGNRYHVPEDGEIIKFCSH